MLGGDGLVVSQVLPGLVGSRDAPGNMLIKSVLGYPFDRSQPRNLGRQFCVAPERRFLRARSWCRPENRGGTRTSSQPENRVSSCQQPRSVRWHPPSVAVPSAARPRRCSAGQLRLHGYPRSLFWGIHLTGVSRVTWGDSSASRRNEGSFGLEAGAARRTGAVPGPHRNRRIVSAAVSSPGRCVGTRRASRFLPRPARAVARRGNSGYMDTPEVCYRMLLLLT